MAQKGRRRALTLNIRSVTAEGMKLLVTQLKHAIDQAARRMGVNSPRVLHKINRFGETVIALILPAEKGIDERRPKDSGRH